MKGLELFELVQSLSRSEKRAFKLSVVYHKDQSLIFILFDHICKLKKENIHLLKNKIKNEKLRKKLSRIKRDLYYKILDFLASYYEENLVITKLYKQIRIGRILLEKKLDQQAWEQLRKAKKQAELYELWNQLLEILVIQRKIINKEPKQRMVATSKSNIEIRETLAKQQQLFEYEQLTGELSTKLGGDGVSKKTKKIVAYRKALETLPPLKYKGYRFSSYYEYIRALYFELMGDIQGAYSCKKRLIEIAYTYPHFIKIDIDRHIMLLFNVINTGIDNCFLEEALSYLEKLELFLDSCSFSLQMKYLPSRWDIQLSCFNRLEQYTKSWALIVEIEEKLLVHESVIEMKGSFLNIISNNLIATCLFVKNYKKALDWINRILNEGKSTLRKDYYINIRFLECLVLIENDLGGLVKAKLRSLRTFLNKNNKLFSLEKWLLSFLHSLASNAHSRKKQKELYKEALIVLKAHKADPMFQIFNYIQWINIVIKS